MQQLQINPEGLAGVFSKRVIGADELAAALGFTRYWVYKRTREGAEDPPPRCKVFQLRFDTWYVPFQEWFNRQLGHQPTQDSGALRVSSHLSQPQ